MGKIETFVFFDLETTDLLKNDPDITELALVACSRDHLLETSDKKEIPRSLQTLVLALNPMKKICSEAMEISGISLHFST